MFWPKLEVADIFDLQRGPLGEHFAPLSWRGFFLWAGHKKTPSR